MSPDKKEDSFKQALKTYNEDFCRLHQPRMSLDTELDIYITRDHLTMSSVIPD